jgi:dUTP pyrophosphatase
MSQDDPNVVRESTTGNPIPQGYVDPTTGTWKPLMGTTDNTIAFPLNGSLFLAPQNCLDVLKLDPDAILPTRAHIGDLGFDLYALEETHIASGELAKVRTGIACGFPQWYGALIRDRSSVATKEQVFVVAGVIDNGYTGEILVAMYNSSRQSGEAGWRKFEKGQKIAQMILVPVATILVREVLELSKTNRGANGFGSTGTK